MDVDEGNDEILGLECESDTELKFCVPEEVEEPCPSSLCLPQLNTIIAGSGPTTILDYLRQVLGPLCDLDCRICENYIHKLSQHIQSKHRNDGVEREYDHDHSNVQTELSVSTVDLDLDSLPDPKSDDQNEEKYEPLSQEEEERFASEIIRRTVVSIFNDIPGASEEVELVARLLRSEAAALEDPQWTPAISLAPPPTEHSVSPLPVVATRPVPQRRHLTGQRRPRLRPGPKRRTHQCNECGATFDRLSSFYTHRRGVHGPGIPCPTCNRTFSTAGNLRRHVAKGTCGQHQ